jgi:hypothetical protein
MIPPTKVAAATSRIVMTWNLVLVEAERSASELGSRMFETEEGTYLQRVWQTKSNFVC